MALVGWLHVVVVLLVVAFVVAMLWLATWALFSDRPRGRLRCPRCWYDLTHSFSLTCSECGHRAESAAHLQRTRRRWGTALLAITALTAAGVHVLDRAAQNGWASLAPTRVLLLFVPFQGDLHGSELDRRLRRGEMTAGELSSFVDRWVTGDWWARPASPAWISKYGQLIWDWHNALPRDIDLNRRLLALPASVQLEARDAWPADVAPVVQLRVLDWWPPGTESRINVTPLLPGATTKTLYRGRTFRARNSVALAWPDAAVGRDELDIYVRVERRAGPSEPWEPGGEQTVTVHVRRLAGDQPRPLLPIVEDSESQLTQAMHATFNQGVVRWSGGRSPLRIRYEPWRTFTAEFDGVAIGVVIDVMRDDGAIARTLRMWWMAGRRVDDDDGRNFGWELPVEDPELMQKVSETDGRWFLRVRGDEALALRAGGGTLWWSGDLRLPLRITSRDDEAPPPSWWVEPSSEPHDAGDPAATSAP